MLKYIHGVRSKDAGIGGLKLWHMYQKKFINSSPVGRDRFEDIVNKYGLKIRLRVRAPKTTDSSHGLPTYPNIIKDFIPTAPNQLWVSDITYITIWLNENEYIFCYLSIILDAYSEEIIGWSVGETLETIYPLQALNMALKRIENQSTVNLVHHSDRGTQYASKDYISLLKEYNIRISMTESGDPKENAQAERINNTIKNEFFKNINFHSLSEVKSAMNKAVAFYNNERPHMSINMLTPSEAALCIGEIPKRWKSHREAAIKKKLEENDITKKSIPLHSSNEQMPIVNFMQEENLTVNFSQV